MTAAALGAPLRRVEDARLLTGQGLFVPDIVLPGEARGVFLRSPHAHAEIASVDAAAARAMPGVVAVYTGADLAADDLPGVPAEVLPPTVQALPPEQRDWRPPHYPALAAGRVRHVGEPAALVVAESLAAAMDAAERIEVDYRPLDAVTDCGAAAAAGAPALWPDRPGNCCFHHRAGDGAAADAAFAAAAHVARLTLVNNRVVAAPLETRGAVAVHDPATGSLTLHTGTQKPHQFRDALARKVFGLPEDRVRVVSPDVGGGFGARNGLYPEFIALLWAARRCGRPIRWIAERTEGMASDVHGRDNLTEAELALDADGRMLALRASTLVNLGAYVAPRAMVPTTNGLQMLTGPYRIAAAFAEVRGVFTNTVPTHVYRGAGRPEGAYVLERLVDHAARRIGLEPAELRRRNLVPPSEMPWRTAFGSTYDRCDFSRALEDALDRAGHAGFAARRAESERVGKRRGLGLALIVEHLHAKGHGDTAGIAVDADGGATLTVGSCSNGQGHETVFAQVAVARLGLPLEAVRFVQGDTATVSAGLGTGASRSATVSGGAVSAALDDLIEAGCAAAAAQMEAAFEDVAFEDGRFRIVGTDRSVGLDEVAAASGGTLHVSTVHKAPADGFPAGCHICEVEVDPDTGAVVVAGYTAVHDFGRLLNPMVVEGQVHGALAQGLGQALLEKVVYDGESGQLLSGSFMDYALPRADDLAPFAVELFRASDGANPLGVKGCGEAGCSAAPPALVNAVLDALAPLGVDDLDMPLTPSAVWSALRRARG
ncbi:MAG: xanthine dehydrogenase family protein molybdopterin-binding subunit [Acetobacterales bacterium]